MATAFEKLKAAELEFDEEVDLGELRQVIDSLEMKFCKLAFQASRRGDHLLRGCSPTSFVAQAGRMSKNAAADRLCVGEQLESLPRIAKALGDGDIGYQAAAVICHLSDQLGEKRDHIREEDWVGFARSFSVKELRFLTYQARQVWDPEGFDRDSEEDYDRRYLSVSEMGRMYRLDGMLDAEGGAAVLAAINSLSKPLGAIDARTPKQRRADAVVELARRAMDAGALPRRSGVRPHLTVSTTMGALKGELATGASQLDDGMPISNKTVQRLACDSTLCRVLKADSVVTDVGRATRSISGSQRRAVNARYRTCCGPGCDRPLSMTDVHHIEFWGRGGRNNLPNLIPVCYFHHRLVHEGGWQVVRAGASIEWIPPERLLIRRTRGPSRHWAA